MRFVRKLKPLLFDSADTTAIPDHKLVFVSFDTAEPAYFLCAVLNSSPIRLLVRSYASYGSISGHIMEYACIPPFRRADAVHRRLARLGKETHDAVADSNMELLAVLEADVDQAVTGLWGITTEEMRAIQTILDQTSAQAPATMQSRLEVGEGTE